MSRLKSILKYIFQSHDEKVHVNKSIIRYQIRKLKEQLTVKEKILEAQLVWNKIEQLPEFINSNVILLYWSIADELSTRDFILKWYKSKKILLPVVVGDEMIIKPFSSRDEMQQGAFGIDEPIGDENYVNQIDIVIVPGIAFDKQKRRLGRGKGYYDKYLREKSILKIGIAYDIQIVKHIPTDHFDIKMDKVFSASYSIE